MPDTSVKKVDAEHAPEGEMGQKYLVSGKKMSMRLWDESPDDYADEGPHSRPYETVGYVLEGRATLVIDESRVVLESGDSWTVPAGAEHHYEIEEPFQAVEATAPPARAHARDEGKEG